MVKPSLANDWAYCTVNMFNAALLILYSGVGRGAKVLARPIEPSVVELFLLA